MEELANGVVDTPALHDSLDDRSEVVAHEDDIRGLLGNLGAGDTHRKPYVGGLEGGTIPCAVSHRQSHRGSGGFQQESSCLLGRIGPGSGDRGRPRCVPVGREHGKQGPL